MWRWFDSALELLYPARCCACGASMHRPGFCATCLAAIPTPAHPQCSVCGVPFGTRSGDDHVCGACLERQPAFDRARACTVYQARGDASDPLKDTLHRYKYRREVGLAVPLADLLRDRLPVAITDYEVVVPVPLHLDRLRWRGFNQALLLARRVAVGVSLDPFVLERVRPTPPQVGLAEADRRRNVHGAFRVRYPETVSGRRVLVVDDVYTTGATVDECSRVLRRAGAAGVDVLTLAHAA